MKESEPILNNYYLFCNVHGFLGNSRWTAVIEAKKCQHTNKFGCTEYTEQTAVWNDNLGWIPETAKSLKGEK